MARSGLIFIIAVLLVSLVTGCAGLPSTKLDKLDSRQVEYAQIIKQSPVVVFENGLAAKMKSWSKVFSEIGSQATVFAYNRPGYGDSDAVSTRRDGAQIVEELRVLLRQNGLQPPYVLVGHSLGGLYMQLFAREHPEEVAGLVLVDSTHPTQFEGPGSLDKWPWWARLLSGLLSDSQKKELAEAKETGQQVLRAPTFEGKPVIVLSAVDDAQSEIALFAKQKRADLPRLYPGSRQKWVNSGHFIQNDKPEEVIQAIQAILKEYRRAPKGDAVSAAAE